MAFTLEFWRSGERIMVEFNLKKFDLPVFLRLAEARKIVDLMHDKIVTQYQAEVDFRQDRMTIVAGFIKRHFLELDKAFDVIVLGNGEIVKFKIEDAPVPE